MADRDDAIRRLNQQIQILRGKGLYEQAIRLQARAIQLGAIEPYSQYGLTIHSTYEERRAAVFRPEGGLFHDVVYEYGTSSPPIGEWDQQLRRFGVSRVGSSESRGRGPLENLDPVIRGTQSHRARENVTGLRYDPEAPETSASFFRRFGLPVIDEAGLREDAEALILRKYGHDRPELVEALVERLRERRDTDVNYKKIYDWYADPNKLRGEAKREMAGVFRSDTLYPSVESEVFTEAALREHARLSGQANTTRRQMQDWMDTASSIDPRSSREAWVEHDRAWANARSLRKTLNHQEQAVRDVEKQIGHLSDYTGVDIDIGRNFDISHARPFSPTQQMEGLFPDDANRLTAAMEAGRDRGTFLQDLLDEIAPTIDGDPTAARRFDAVKKELDRHKALLDKRTGLAYRADLAEGRIIANLNHLDALGALPDGPTVPISFGSGPFQGRLAHAVEVVDERDWFKHPATGKWTQISTMSPKEIAEMRRVYGISLTTHAGGAPRPVVRMRPHAPVEPGRLHEIGARIAPPGGLPEEEAVMGAFQRWTPVNQPFLSKAVADAQREYKAAKKALNAHVKKTLANPTLADRTTGEQLDRRVQAARQSLLVARRGEEGKGLRALQEVFVNPAITTAARRATDDADWRNLTGPASQAALQAEEYLTQAADEVDEATARIIRKRVRAAAESLQKQGISTGFSGSLSPTMTRHVANILGEGAPASAEEMVSELIAGSLYGRGKDAFVPYQNLIDDILKRHKSDADVGVVRELLGEVLPDTRGLKGGKGQLRRFRRSVQSSARSVLGLPEHNWQARQSATRRRARGVREEGMFNRDFAMSLDSITGEGEERASSELARAENRAFDSSIHAADSFVDQVDEVAEARAARVRENADSLMRIRREQEQLVRVTKDITASPEEVLAAKKRINQLTLNYNALRGAISGNPKEWDETLRLMKAVEPYSKVTRAIEAGGTLGDFQNRIRVIHQEDVAGLEAGIEQLKTMLARATLPARRDELTARIAEVEAVMRDREERLNVFAQQALEQKSLQLRGVPTQALDPLEAAIRNEQERMADARRVAVRGRRMSDAERDVIRDIDLYTQLSPEAHERLLSDVQRRMDWDETITGHFRDALNRQGWGRDLSEFEGDIFFGGGPTDIFSRLERVRDLEQEIEMTLPDFQRHLSYVTQGATAQTASTFRARITGVDPLVPHDFSKLGVTYEVASDSPVETHAALNFRRLYENYMSSVDPDFVMPDVINREKLTPQVIGRIKEMARAELENLTVGSRFTLQHEFRSFADLAGPGARPFEEVDPDEFKTLEGLGDNIRSRVGRAFRRRQRDLLAKGPNQIAAGLDEIGGMVPVRGGGLMDEMVDLQFLHTNMPNLLKARYAASAPKNTVTATRHERNVAIVQQQSLWGAGEVKGLDGWTAVHSVNLTDPLFNPVIRGGQKVDLGKDFSPILKEIDATLREQHGLTMGQVRRVSESFEGRGNIRGINLGEGLQEVDEEVRLAARRAMGMEESTYRHFLSPLARGGKVEGAGGRRLYDLMTEALLRHTSAEAGMDAVYEAAGFDMSTFGDTTSITSAIAQHLADQMHALLEGGDAVDQVLNLERNQPIAQRLAQEKASVWNAALRPLFGNLKDSHVGDAADFVEEAAEKAAEAARTTAKQARFNFESIQKLWRDVSHTGKAGAGLVLGGLAIAGVARSVRKRKDHTQDDIAGPPMLPGGSAYDAIPDRQPQFNSVPYGYTPPPHQPGVQYKVRTRGSYDPGELEAILSDYGPVSGTINPTISRPNPAQDPEVASLYG